MRTKVLFLCLLFVPAPLFAKPPSNTASTIAKNVANRATKVVALSKRLQKIKRTKRSEPRVPRIVKGAPIVGPAIRKEDIKHVITSSLASIKPCYTTLLRSDANASGKITVRFQIDSSGNVDSPHIATSSMDDTKMKECLLEHIKALQFPAPLGGGTVRVTYPFVFKPETTESR